MKTLNNKPSNFDNLTRLVNILLNDKLSLIKYVLLYAVLMFSSVAIVATGAVVVKLATVALFVVTCNVIRLFIKNDMINHNII